ncbi:MAG: tRNA (guanine-N7)-methyltransferase [Peptococcaceae bacterium BICA1-8]|nr:MAG: tRNA (guanine-N7)-methyltransferase [Peptococcaceae bacterium BICA1-8]
MSRVRRKAGTKEALLALSPPLVVNPKANRGNWQGFFNNNNKIHIELGMGRGTFIFTLAQRNPDINFIGLEIKEEVLITGIKKTLDYSLPNLAYVWGDVNDLSDYFANEEVARIYINFCDPWPKFRHTKRRITHGNFLDIYQIILQERGEIHFKTDNEDLFEFSLNMFRAKNWGLKDVSLDFYRDLPLDNVPTEYELKFVEQGLKIFRLAAINI